MKIIITFIGLVCLSSCSSQPWYALGRYGSCFDLAEFSKSDPIISGAQTPWEIEKKLKKAGIKYTLTKNSNGLINLDVPSKEWGLMLVPKNLCHEFANTH